NGNCAGVGAVTGTNQNLNIAIAIGEGASTLNLTGTVSADGKSMSGTYSDLGGGCSLALSGSWSAFQVPALSGNFTGTISNSSYMALATGMNPAAPIAVSGTLLQGPNIGASNATITGTINASGYPCFATAAITGTITGASVVLSVFGFDGTQIGTIGLPGAPAMVVSDPSGTSLVGTSNVNGLALGSNSGSGPCPELFDPNNNFAPVQYDNADIKLTLQ
ncbi:MAG: hypothetical protein JOY93_04830, partial [Acidobacteriales bacterium]|nr:hypothetical protein [Terriglobales bacterium]